MGGHSVKLSTCRCSRPTCTYVEMSTSKSQSVKSNMSPIKVNCTLYSLLELRQPRYRSALSGFGRDSVWSADIPLVFATYPRRWRRMALACSERRRSARWRLSSSWLSRARDNHVTGCHSRPPGSMTSSDMRRRTDAWWLRPADDSRPARALPTPPTRNLNETRSPTVARIAHRTGCQWPSRSSKVDDFHLIWEYAISFKYSIAIYTVSPIPHRLATIHPTTDDRWQTTIVP